MTTGLTTDCPHCGLRHVVHKPAFGVIANSWRADCPGCGKRVAYTTQVLVFAEKAKADQTKKDPR